MNETVNIKNNFVFPTREILSKIFPFDDNDIFGPVIKSCRWTFFKIKYNNKDVNKMRSKQLSLLVFGILYYYSKNKKELYKPFKKYLLYLSMFEDFFKLVICKEQRRCVYDYVKNKNLDYNNFIKHIKNKPCEPINIDTINKLKTCINELKIIIETTCKSTIEIFNNEQIEDADVLINIITSYLNKINKFYKLVNYFNKPELEIYNYVVNQKAQYPQIIQVFTNIKIPVSRKHNFPKLSADTLIVFSVGDTIKLAIIEYDGPTHYNINDFRFNDNIIWCDRCKNKFCNDENISLLRLDYKNTMNNCFENINLFINQVINSNVSIYSGIPTDDFYDKLLLSYYNKIK